MYEYYFERRKIVFISTDGSIVNLVCETNESYATTKTYTIVCTECVFAVLFLFTERGTMRDENEPLETFIHYSLVLLSKKIGVDIRIDDFNVTALISVFLDSSISKSDNKTFTVLHGIPILHISV